MRVAPPVQALSCSAGPWLSIQLGLYALGGAVAVWWATATLWAPGTGSALAAVVTGAVAAIVALQVQSAPPARLTWDGSVWRVHGPGEEACAGRVLLMLDLGHWMLVRFIPVAGVPQGARSALWLPLSRRDAAAAWPALRVALHASPPAQPAA